jgi:hypothetical protein
MVRDELPKAPVLLLNQFNGEGLDELLNGHGILARLIQKEIQVEMVDVVGHVVGDVGLKGANLLRQGGNLFSLRFRDSRILLKCDAVALGLLRRQPHKNSLIRLFVAVDLVTRKVTQL